MTNMVVKADIPYHLTQACQKAGHTLDGIIKKEFELVRKSEPSPLDCILLDSYMRYRLPKQPTPTSTAQQHLLPHMLSIE
jgi:hypothetical protein